MTNLHVRNIIQTIVGHHITPGFEKHHGERATGLHIADDEFCNHVEARLLIRDGLNDACDIISNIFTGVNGK